jgi:hypothetical protein
MQIRKVFVVYTFFLISISVQAQSFWFGPKIGPGINTQRWMGSERQAMYSINYSVFLETYSDESPTSFHAQLGYHTRGSSIATFGLFGGFNRFSAFKYNNAMLELGGKQRLSIDKKFNPFYMLGLRAEYNLKNNLAQFNNSPFNSLIFPQEQFVRKFVYGITFGGGFETRLSAFVGAAIEIAFCPDIEAQYWQPVPITGIIHPITNQPTTIPEQVIRNNSLEVRLVFKFLRKVVYID